MKTVLNLTLLISILLVSLKQADSQAVYNKIVFSGQENPEDCDLWLMNLDGTNQTKIFNSPFSDTDPHFRFDGSKIVFTRWISGAHPVQDIYTVNPDGTGMINLTTDIVEEVSQPKWSWTGNKIVFCKTIGIDDKDIYTMNPDGSNKKAVATGRNNDNCPVFSPDGLNIAFQRFIGPIANQKSKICLLNITQGMITDLTDGSNLDGMPTFSPDGKYLLFKRGTSSPEIYRLKIDSGSLENLTNNSSIDDAPSYSYDGNKIVWMQAANGLSSTGIWTMNSDGSDKKQLSSLNVSGFNPSFAPTSQSGFSNTAYPEKHFNVFQYGNEGLVFDYQCNSSKTLTLEIYDMMGKLLTERNIEAESNESRFFVRQISLKNGIYIGILFDQRGCLGGSKFIFRN